MHITLIKVRKDEYEQYNPAQKQPHVSGLLLGPPVASKAATCKRETVTAGGLGSPALAGTARSTQEGGHLNPARGWLRRKEVGETSGKQGSVRKGDWQGGRRPGGPSEEVSWEHKPE